ncbi:hypothetical protein L596_000564 [Steinernema carpocapsae]|nr:hypothetical protein L596_000564 [Steinernema carpocapsae]
MIDKYQLKKATIAEFDTSKMDYSRARAGSINECHKSATQLTQFSLDIAVILAVIAKTKGCSDLVSIHGHARSCLKSSEGLITCNYTEAVRFSLLNGAEACLLLKDNEEKTWAQSVYRSRTWRLADKKQSSTSPRNLMCNQCCPIGAEWQDLATATLSVKRLKPPGRVPTTNNTQTAFYDQQYPLFHFLRNGQAKVMCENHEFLATCTEQGHMNEEVLTFYRQQVEQNCEILCPQQATNFKMSGILNAARGYVEKPLAVISEKVGKVIETMTMFRPGVL